MICAFRRILCLHVLVASMNNYRRHIVYTIFLRFPTITVLITKKAEEIQIPEMQWKSISGLFFVQFNFIQSSSNVCVL